MDEGAVNLLKTENAACDSGPEQEIVIPEGVSDVADWTCWVRELYRQGKQEWEVRTARRIIRDLLRAGYSEESLKVLRNKFAVEAVGLRVKDVETMMILLMNSDFEEEYSDNKME